MSTVSRGSRYIWTTTLKKDMMKPSATEQIMKALLRRDVSAGTAPPDGREAYSSPISAATRPSKPGNTMKAADRARNQTRTKTMILLTGDNGLDASRSTRQSTPSFSGSARRTTTIEVSGLPMLTSEYEVKLICLACWYVPVSNRIGIGIVSGRVLAI